MFSEEELLDFLDSRFQPRVVILYGSAAHGQFSSAGDIDLVCFTTEKERYPEALLWNDQLLDVWVHPLEDAEAVDDFRRLHDGRVLRDDRGLGQALVDRVAARLSVPPPKLDQRHDRHRRDWIWKMFDRASRGDIEGHHRRHWLLHDLPETWCDLSQRHYLGPSHTLKQVRIESPATYQAFESALKPDASLNDVERLVIAVVGKRQS
jgi:predicted nucleotidyltransferase